MSHENVEVVRRVTEAVLRLDEDAFIECCQADVQWEENTLVYPGLRPIYSGHTGARQWFSDVTDAWSDMRVERADYRDVGDDRVLVDLSFAARGKASGVETTLRIWAVLWLINRKIARRQLFLDEDDALKAVGLEE